MRCMISCSCVVALVLFMSTALSHATPIASDSFATTAGGNDYVTFVSILGQNPTVGAGGFLGPWGNCCTGALLTVPGGLTHALTPGETFDGQLIAFTSDSSATRNLSRAIDYAPVDGTYYMSVLFHKYAETTRGDLLAGLGRSQNPEASVFEIDGTYIGFVDGGITFFSGPGAHLTELVTAAEMNIYETYFALLQYDITTSDSDTVTATIFDGSSVEVASQAFPGLNLDESMGRFSVFTQDFGPIPAMDEWRFGTELSDVMVPEPATCFMLLVGIVAMMIGCRTGMLVMSKATSLLAVLALIAPTRLYASVVIDFDSLIPGNNAGNILAADYGVTFTTGDMPDAVSVGDIITFSNAVNQFQIRETESTISPPNCAGPLGNGTKDLLMSFDTPVAYVELSSDDAAEPGADIIRLDSV